MSMRESDPTRANDFNHYEQLLARLNHIHPQHQGLGLEEFTSALSDATTITTDVIAEDGTRFEVPQLARIGQYEWLNDGFYKKTYPAEFDSDKLLCYSDLPGVDPGERVIERLRELAHQGGVIAFDTPSADPEMQERVLRLLAENGIEYEEPELLGTQTYFAGEPSFKREHTKREMPLTFPEAYDEQVAKGIYDPNASNGVVLKHTLTGEEADYVYNFFDAAYQVLNDHPCKQGLSPEEFREMTVSDPDVGKIMYLHDGVPESAYLTCEDLTKLSWVNPEYYKLRYPEKYEKRQVVWFPGIATDPRPEVAGKNSEDIIKFISELFEAGDNDFVIVFDFCDINTAWLADHLNNLINSTPEARVNIQPIATQQYWGVRLKPGANS